MAAAMLAVLIVFRWPVWMTPTIMPPQNPQAQHTIDEIKEAATRNKQALAQYRWQQQETVTVKGEVKKQDLFQVELGPDGKPQKTPMAQDEDYSSSNERQHSLMHKLGEKKAAELRQYAQQIKELAQSYAQPDPERLQQAYQQGNISVGTGDAAGAIRLVIHNYVKPGDSVTIFLNRSQKERSQKEFQGIDVSTYLNHPKDAVKLNVEFDQAPDGTNHISDMLITGVSKQLTVAIKNFNYRKM